MMLDLISVWPHIELYGQTLWIELQERRRRYRQIPQISVGEISHKNASHGVQIQIGKPLLSDYQGHPQGHKQTSDVCTVCKYFW